MEGNHLKSALDELSKKWEFDEQIYDLTLGRRNDVKDTPVQVNDVIFHIPMLTNENSYVLWDCLWPRCHNCCEKQGRLPLTVKDIEAISEKLHYTKKDFMNKETMVSCWTESELFGDVLTSLSMISLKRREDETDEQDGTSLSCRFLDGEGSCKLHPSRPGCCQMYPFISWITVANGKPQVHATFQFDGRCPGFYLSKSLDEIAEVLEHYSKLIVEYNNDVSRTTREGYGFISIGDLRSRH
ncbi:MAG: YkgJ family cysteine cluster protein [Nitrososphaerales archaeon]